MALSFISTQAESSQTNNVNFGHPVDESFLALSGFRVGYSGDDHEVKTITISWSQNQKTSQSIEYTPNLSIVDNSGNTGGGTLYLTGVGKTEGDPTQFASVDGWTPSKGGLTATFANQPTPLDQAWVFIKGVNLTYGSGVDYSVRTITIDSGNSDLVTTSTDNGDGTYTWTVGFTPTLTMADASGHSSSNSSSWMNFMVVATAAPTA